MVEIKHSYIGSKETIIVFSSIGNTIEGVNQEFYKLKNYDYNVIWVMDPDRSWFNRVDPDTIKRHIKTDIVYAVGNSMGATNATLFSNFYKVKKVLGFSPQYSVDPTVVPWETRWMEHRKHIKNFKYSKMTFVPWTEYTFIHGHKDLDKRHINMMPDKPYINTHQITGGHHIAQKFKTKGTLHQLINSYFKDDIKITDEYLQSLL